MFIIRAVLTVLLLVSFNLLAYESNDKNTRLSPVLVDNNVLFYEELFSSIEEENAAPWSMGEWLVFNSEVNNLPNFQLAMMDDENGDEAASDEDDSDQDGKADGGVIHVKDELELRHGVVQSSQELSVEGGGTSVYQAGSDGRLDDEWLTSIDFLTVIRKGPNEWFIFVEGNTSSQAGGVSSTIGEANGDAGSAYDRDDKGRLQVSEFHYSFPFTRGRFNVGLINPAGSLDASDVVNDETGQFLSSVLVNNPTIALPDYTLGAAINYGFESNLALTLLVSSSHGLGDNDNRSYSELVDLTAPGKGTFIAAEFHSHYFGMDIRAGIWQNSAENEYLDGRPGSSSNSGIYTTIDGNLLNGHWNIRYGIADDEVSDAESFTSFALEYPIRSTTVGVGFARTNVSENGKTASNSDNTVTEIYANHSFTDSISVSSSIQWIENSGFDNSDDEFDSEMTVFSIRVGYAF